MDAITHLLGHRITEQLYAGSRTLVYRGVREIDAVDASSAVFGLDGKALRLRTPVVIKLLRNEYPDFNELVWFRNQYTIAKNLDLPSIVKPLDLAPYKNAYALVMEDFGGVSLSAYLKAATDRNQPSKSLSLQDFLNLALQLADTIHYLYQNRVIHKDIKPANILINPDTKQIKLIDFSIASLLPRQTQEIQNPNILEGTLAYLSPEQTGRMNRGIDYRSDFYSLGVTFYELLTGQLPFISDDPMELVHCHLAKEPISVHQIKPEISLILSQIVSKLMAKNAEDRYQSALGLKHDLEICLVQFQKTGKIEFFELGQRDITDRFLIPEKLYGRETEVANLLAAFERVATSPSTRSKALSGNEYVEALSLLNQKAEPSQRHDQVEPGYEGNEGRSELMLVAGFSGIGKTAVVNEVHKPIVRQRGYFIKGKYDQFQRNIPFSAFVQAFRDLMGQLLSESDAQLQIWKTRILSAVGDNGQVLIEVIPELERIIGTQPPAPELSGSAAQNRFNLLMQKFVQVFTQVEHPLVMFLDDLQWADGASLKLLQLLMQDIGHLLVLGAYRDNEVSPVHPFILTVDEIVKSGATVNTITLQPLSLADMNQLVADTLNCDRSLAQPLTELVYQKTKGNPFFATQFLKALHDDGLITFDGNIRYWQCDISQVRALAITDDVVEFMALQLQKLPTQTQEVIKLAACIGAQFDLATLAIVSEKSPEETAADLWKALQEGLLVPTTEVYKFFTQSDDIATVNPTAANANYKFLHDRVQQAAYSLIPDSQKKATHLKVGQLLQQNSSEIEQEEKLFDIVGHLNLGEELITQPSEREALAQLNLKAGRKARSSTAYAAANIYLQTGIELLTANCWQSQYELTLNLYVDATEAAYLNADFYGMEQMAKLVLQKAQSILDKVKIYQISIAAQIAQGKMLEAIAIARDALGQLGVGLPTAPDEASIGKALQSLANQLSGRRIEELVDLPVMSDATTQAAMQLLGMLPAPVSLGMPGLLPILSSTMVSLSLQFGNAPASSVGYVIHGLMLCAFLGEAETGYGFGRLALNLLDRFNARELKSIVLVMFCSTIQHHQEAISAAIPMLKDGYTAGMETGDFLHAGYNIVAYSYTNFFAGVELDTWELELAGYSAALAQMKQYSHAYLDMMRQTVQNLREIVSQPDCLIGTAYDEMVMIPKHYQDNELSAIGYAYIYKLLLAYCYGNYTAALDHIAQAKQYLMAVSGTINVPIFHFYTALTHLALFPTQLEIEQAEILSQVENHQIALQKWAKNAPMNYLHKWYLVEAERHRVLGNKAEAIEMYDRAISLAKENQFLNEEALANELTAKFYFDWGKEKVAQAYMIEAYYCYARWGAKAKVDDLEKRYPQLLAPILQQSRSSTSFKGTITQGTIASSRSSSSVSEALDLATLLKASQAISGEIELDRLLTTLLKIVITNAGADKCVLLLKQDIELQLAALVEEGQEPDILPRMPLESSQDVAISLVNTVKRSLKPLVLVDARVNPQFAGDRYIEQHQPKSILCSPILNQGKLIGILYLENNLTVGAFTNDRVEVLNLICSQAAISLENARLYQESQQAFTDLKQAQLKIVQSEKMSALGNLVAGVAHEINNPVGFLAGNITFALDYINDLFKLIDLFQQEYPNYSAAIQEEIEAIDLDYIREDLPKLVGSMHEGVKRIKGISTSLRIFSRADSDRPVACNIHDGIESTLTILKHRLKASDTRPEIQVIKKYGDLPQVECYAGQLNQVFMNLLGNAIDALDESNQGRSYGEITNQITIETELSPDRKQAVISIKDNGVGMTEAVRKKIFDDSFTTKGVGKGTGLGLAIARQIVVEKHCGTLEVNSTLGQGAEFTIAIPVKANVAFMESQNG